jgi:SAM-dependent methyltransferase
MRGNFQEREKSIAETSFSSASPHDQVAFIMGLPEDVSGLTIVDIGAGTSTAVAELNKRGAAAVGADPGYLAINRLVRSTEKYLKGKQREGDIAGFRRGSTVLEAFRADYQRNRNRYIGAYAGALPFEDNSVDIAYSMLAVSHFLSVDRDVLFGAVDEALRVLKPADSSVPAERRSIILQPWFSRSAEVPPAKRHNSLALEASLTERGIPFSVESIAGVSPRIRIVKP